MNKCSQASGAVRFFHRKHECYIIGEGSFVGRYGKLPDLSEDDDSGHEIAESIQISTLRRRSSVGIYSPTSKSSLQLEVKAQMEPICEVKTSVSILPSLCEFESQEEKIEFQSPPTPSSLLPELQSHTRLSHQRQSLDSSNAGLQSQTNKFPSLPGDDVISEDGKRCYNA